VTTTGALTINDIETVNLNSTSSEASITHTVSTLTAGAASSVTVNASTAGMTIDAMTGTTKAVLVDASASAKAVSITTGAVKFEAINGVAFKMGQGDDTLVLTDADTTAADATDLDFVIYAGKGADTITLAAPTTGVDKIVYTAADQSTATKYDTINNFNAGVTQQDLLDLTAFGFTGNAVGVKTVTTGVTINGATNAVEVASTAAANFFVDAGLSRGVAEAEIGGALYVFVDANKDGNWDAASDMVIKLAGVNATDFDVADIVFA
jgi:hypothetical protein